MKKEAVFAILIGLALGLVIAYGVYTANQATEKNKLMFSNEQTAFSPPPSVPSEMALVVFEPENNIVTGANEATISGKTDSKAVVAVLAENQEDIFLADEQGFFSTSINLISGLNELKVVVINKSGVKKEKLIQLIQSTASL